MSSNHPVLFLVAHPLLERSRANRAVTEAVTGTPGVTVRRLYDLYPYFDIDVEAEQKLLEEHQLLFVQHPLYWYSMPPLLKMWLDEVWESGWAYGPGGEALKGKDFQLSISAGGSREAYSQDGTNRFTLATLLSPWNQTIHLCKMRWHEPLVLHGAMATGREALIDHAQGIRRSLEHYVQHGRWK